MVHARIAKEEVCYAKGGRRRQPEKNAQGKTCPAVRFDALDKPALRTCSANLITQRLPRHPPHQVVNKRLSYPLEMPIRMTGRVRCHDDVG